MSELLGGLKSAREHFLKQHGDHAAMVCMRLDQAMEMLPALTKERNELQATITSCEEEVAKIYTDITNNRFSKMNTRAEHVLAAVEEIHGELAKEFDRLQERSVAAMAIAEGDEGWEKLLVDCPMLGAVTALKKHFDIITADRNGLMARNETHREDIARLESVLIDMGTDRDNYKAAVTSLEHDLASAQFAATQWQAKAEELAAKKVSP